MKKSAIAKAIKKLKAQQLSHRTELLDIESQIDSYNQELWQIETNLVIGGIYMIADKRDTSPFELIRIDKIKKQYKFTVCRHPACGIFYFYFSDTTPIHSIKRIN